MKASRLLLKALSAEGTKYSEEEMTNLREVACRIKHYVDVCSHATSSAPCACEEIIESILQGVVEEAVMEFAEGHKVYTTHDFTREKEIEYRARSAGKAEGLELGAKAAGESSNSECSCAEEIAIKIRGLKA